MTDFGLFCVSSHRQGEPSFYSARERGTVHVLAADEGPKLYVYRLPPGSSARDFRTWMKAAWSAGGRDARVTGRWPSYTVET